MTMNTVFVAHEIIHVIWKALNRALPELSCAGWSKAVHGISAARLDGEAAPQVIYHWAGAPAAGAVNGRDGFNLIGHLIALGGLVLPNLETYEKLYPVTFRSQEFRLDAAGPGEYRGGSGCDYQVDVEAPAQTAFRGEGLDDVSSFGVGGGGAGAVGEMTITTAEGGPEKAPKYGVRDYPPLTMRALSPGGGGWGEPRRRPPEAVLRDVRDGIVSPAAAAAVYGVALGADGRSINWPATEQLRAAARP